VTVPPFFSTSAYAYRTLVEATGIQDVVDRSIASLDPREDGAIEQFSENLSSALKKISFPAALQHELLSAYRKLTGVHPDVTGVAVRSSAVVEDAESSFAGQFESILNVLESNLCEAYEMVIASKYRAEVLKYAAARGFFEEDIAMPVLVMAMVQPFASGVAYSRCPDRPESTMVTAVRGLAQAMDSGLMIPDIYLISTADRSGVEVSPGKCAFSLRCAAGGGLTEFREDASHLQGPVLNKEAVSEIARTALALENHFGVPQDIEWAIDESGALIVVQTRPLSMLSRHGWKPSSERGIEGCRILARGARGCGGAASGAVHKIDLRAIETVPEGVVLCIPTTTPKIAGVMGKVRAIVAAAGSPTGHMATIAREFQVPCVVGAENSISVLTPGRIVTVDGDAGVVYEGVVPELLQPETRHGYSSRQRDPMQESLRSFLDKVAPLTLTEPDAPGFTPDNCRTFHDIARYVHQKSVTETFNLDELSSQERRAAHRLLWRAPIEVMLLDVGEGLVPDVPRNVKTDHIRSTPLLALIEGMTDPRLRWAGPVGFDFKGFMSVVVHSAADDQRYGEPNYCLCARDYVHFASRLAYHFATVDALCGRSVNENYARFLFFGGAAVAVRREWRAHFLASVLHANDFTVNQVGDRVEGMLAKRNSEQIEEALVMLGRLMVASRHLDMVIESRAAANALARAFLSGDYGFERVRTTGV
jgi:pyruvate,water dikinase